MDSEKDNSQTAEDSARQMFEDRIHGYKNIDESCADDSRFKRAFERLKILLETERLRDWVFGPFCELFRAKDKTTASQVRVVITGVALVNAIFGGLPGKMGVGVLISMALEAYMALRIAQHVGITSIKTPKDALRAFGALASTAVVVLWVFKQLLGFGFSLFNLVGALPALLLAEFFVTDFVGVLLWVGFGELKEGGTFKIPKRSLLRVTSETKSLMKHQYSVLKGTLRPRNIKKVARNVKAWLTGDLILTPPVISDRAFISVAMASLLAGQNDALEGPLGEMFLQSIRDLYPALSDATVSEISDHFQQYNETQMEGVFNQIKGTLHEHMVMAAENSDGDQWIAQMHEDPYHPSTDLIYTNTDTNEMFEVSLKATNSSSYVESALARYPDDPVMVTKEVAEDFWGDARVYSSEIGIDDLNAVTEENFDELLDQTEPTGGNVAEGIFVGVSLAAVASLWPYFIAWQRKRITQEEFKKA